MPGLALFALIQGAITFISKFIDGKKTKIGLGLVAVGTGVSAVSLWGVDIAPDQILGVIKQVLGLFGYQVTDVADAAAQSLLGNLLSFVGGAIALYGYYRKGQVVAQITLSSGLSVSCGVTNFTQSAIQVVAWYVGWEQEISYESQQI